MSTKRSGYWMLAALAATLFAGCGEETLSLAPVSGKVTLDGKPVPSGVVIFSPDADQGTTGPNGSGHLNRDGTFRIRTAQRDGAVPGQHRVRINLYLPSPEDDFPSTSIPQRYMSDATSGLTADVAPDTQNDYHFELFSTGGIR